MSVIYQYKKSKKQRKNYKKFNNILLRIIGILVGILVCILLVNQKTFIYPEQHESQPSPLKIVQQKAKVLPTEFPKPEVIEHGSRQKHEIALTFDADMTQIMYLMLQQGFVKSWYNRPIKETLDKEQVKATIFFSGLWVKSYVKETKELAQDPLIEIGNHSFDHPAFTQNCYKLPGIKNISKEDEVMDAQKIISDTTGITPKYFRFPGGCYDKIDLATISKLGLKIVHWDVAANDGFNKNTASIVKNVMSKVQNGSIIVFHIHDGPYAPKTNDALLEIIPKLKQQRYTFVTISELLENN